MTKEQRDLLFEDLCGRIPYGVKISVNDNVEILQGINILDTVVEYDSCLSSDIEEVKPYLFPMSSMIEEQKKYINDRWGVNENFDFEIDPNWGEYFVELSDVLGFINWCYENHLDINGLIPKGLAIDATNLKIY